MVFTTLLKEIVMYKSKEFSKIQLKILRSNEKVKETEIFKSTIPVDEINKTYDQLGKYHHIKKQILKFPFHHSYQPKKIEQIKYRFISLEKMILWLSNILKEHHIELNDFFNKQLEYYNCLFLEDYDHAENIINDIESKFGLSFWLLEKKINLIQHKYGLEKQKEFFKEIINNENVHFIHKYMSSFFSLKSEFNVSTHNYDQEVLKEQSELKRAKEPGLINYQNYLKYKIDLSNLKECEMHLILLMEEDLSIIDRYFSLVEVLTRIVLEEKENDIFEWKNKNDVYNNLGYLKGQELQIIIKKFFTDDNSVYANEDFESYTKILDLYTFGNYPKVIDMSEKLLNKNPLLFELYEIYSKSLLHLTLSPKLKHPMSEEIVEKVMLIYSNDLNSSEVFSGLLKICYNHSSSLWSWKLRNLITNAYLGQKQALKNKISSQGALISYSSRPQINIDLYTNNRLQELNKALEKAYPENFTFKLHNKIAEKDDDFIKGLTNIPNDRKYDILAKVLLSKKNYKESLKILKKIEGDNSIYSTDIKCLIVDTQIEMGDLNEALTYTVDSYFQNKNVLNKINIDRLVEELLKDTSFYISNISLPILLDLVSKYHDVKKEVYRNDIYEDFLFTKNVARPSELNLNDYVYENKEKWIYFLNKVCTVNVMSHSIEYKTLEEVENERMIICRLLSNYDEENKVFYSNEIKSLTEKKMIQKGINKIHSSKIFVNVEGIKISLEKKMSEAFNRYKSFGYSLIEEQEPEYFTFGEVKINIPGNNKWNLLVNMIDEIRENFVYSAEYGLDGYLSVGIRHGTLSGHLRGSIEKYNLITQVSSSIQSYSENKIWLDRLKILDQSERKKFSNKFNIFSQKIDNLINFLKNELIQIKSNYGSTYFMDDAHPKGLFDYSINISDLNYLNSLIKEDTTFEDFFDNVIEFFWKITDRNLQSIQFYLKNEFSNKIKMIFEEFSNDLETISSNVDLTQIKSEIINAQQDFTHALERVTSWFNKSQDTEIGDYNLELPIEIGLNVAMTIYNIKPENINKKIEINNNIILNERTFKSMGDIFYILFENIFKHSERKENIDIFVSCTSEKNNITIKCCNNLSEQIDVISFKKLIEDKQNKFNLNQDINMASKEGGSGFYKIKKMLSVDLNCKLNIYFKINKDNFFEICLDIEGDEILVENLVN